MTVEENIGIGVEKENRERTVSLYIKFNKISDQYLFVISFHEQEHPLSYYFKSTSANTGVPPQYNTQFALAAKVSGVVMTSSPGPMPAAKHAQ